MIFVFLSRKNIRAGKSWLGPAAQPQVEILSWEPCALGRLSGVISTRVGFPCSVLRHQGAWVGPGRKARDETSGVSATASGATPGLLHWPAPLWVYFLTTPICPTLLLGLSAGWKCLFQLFRISLAQREFSKARCSTSPHTHYTPEITPCRCLRALGLGPVQGEPQGPGKSKDTDLSKDRLPTTQEESNHWGKQEGHPGKLMVLWEQWLS